MFLTIFLWPYKKKQFNDMKVSHQIVYIKIHELSKNMVNNHKEKIVT